MFSILLQTYLIICVVVFRAVLVSFYENTPPQLAAVVVGQLDSFQLRSFHWTTSFNDFIVIVRMIQYSTDSTSLLVLSLVIIDFYIYNSAH